MSYRSFFTSLFFLSFFVIILASHALVFDFMFSPFTRLSDEYLVHLTENVLAKVPPESVLDAHFSQRKRNAARNQKKASSFPKLQQVDANGKAYGTPERTEEGVEEYLYNEDNMQRGGVWGASSSSCKTTITERTEASPLNASAPVFLCASAEPAHEQRDQQISALIRPLLLACGEKAEERTERGHLGRLGSGARRSSRGNRSTAPPPSSLSSLHKGMTSSTKDHVLDGKGRSYATGATPLPTTNRTMEGKGNYTPTRRERLTKEIAQIPKEAEALHQRWAMIVPLIPSSSVTTTAETEIPLPSSAAQWRRPFLESLHHTMRILCRWYEVVRELRPARLSPAALGKLPWWMDASSSTSLGSCSSPESFAKEASVASLYVYLRGNVLPRGILLALTPLLDLLFPLFPVASLSFTSSDEDEEDDEDDDGEEGREEGKEGQTGRKKSHHMRHAAALLWGYFFELSPLVLAVLCMEDMEDPTVPSTPSSLRLPTHTRTLPGRKDTKQGEPQRGSQYPMGLGGPLSGTEHQPCSTSFGRPPSQPQLSLSRLLPLLWRLCLTSPSGTSADVSIEGKAFPSLFPADSSTCYLNPLAMAIQQWWLPFQQACAYPLEKVLHFHFSSASSQAGSLLHPSFFFEVWQRQRERLSHLRSALERMLCSPTLRAFPSSFIADCPDVDSDTVTFFTTTKSSMDKRRRENGKVVLSLFLELADRVLTHRAMQLFKDYFSWPTLVESVLHPNILKALWKEKEAAETTPRLQEKGLQKAVGVENETSTGEDTPFLGSPAKFPGETDTAKHEPHTRLQGEEDEEKDTEASKPAGETIAPGKPEEKTSVPIRASLPPPSSSSCFRVPFSTAVADAARSFVLLCIHCGLEFITSLGLTSRFSTLSNAFIASTLLRRLFHPIEIREIWLEHLVSLVTPPSVSHDTRAVLGKDSPEVVSKIPFPPPQGQRRALLLQPRGPLRRLWRRPQWGRFTDPSASLPDEEHTSAASFSPPQQEKALSLLAVPDVLLPASPLLAPDFISLAEEDRRLRYVLLYPTLHVLRAMEEVVVPLVCNAILLPQLHTPASSASSPIPFRWRKGEAVVMVKEWTHALWEQVITPCLLTLLRVLEKGGGGGAEGWGAGGMGSGTSVRWPLGDDEWQVGGDEEEEATLPPERVHNPEGTVPGLWFSTPFTSSSEEGAHHTRRRAGPAPFLLSSDSRQRCRAHLSNGNRLGFPFHHQNLFDFYRREEVISQSPCRSLGWWRPARALLVELECLQLLQTSLRRWRVRLGEDPTVVEQEDLGETTTGNTSTPQSRRKGKHTLDAPKTTHSAGAMLSLLLALQHEHTLEELFLCCDRGVDDCFSVLPSTFLQWAYEEVLEHQQAVEAAVLEEKKRKLVQQWEAYAEHDAKDDKDDDQEDVEDATKGRGEPSPLLSPCLFPMMSSSPFLWLTPSVGTTDAWQALNTFLYHGLRAATMKEGEDDDGRGGDREILPSLPGITVKSAVPPGGPAEPLALLQEVWAMVEVRIQHRLHRGMKQQLMAHVKHVSSSSMKNYPHPTEENSETYTDASALSREVRQTGESVDHLKYRELVYSFQSYLNRIGCTVAASMLPVV